MALKNGFTEKQIARCISSKRLELTILPTEKCNFRCTYCYEDFAIGRMKKPVIDGLKNLIKARANDIHELSISWFGGEPLVAMSVIREIAAFGASLAAEHEFSFEGGLTTNGYLLTPETLAELVGYNQNFFQITLDGWRDVHDLTRKRADGAGTFDVIWSNLLKAKETDLTFEILLRIHLTNSNFESLKILCQEIHVAFTGDNRFRLDFQDVRDLGGGGGEMVVPIGPNEFKSRVAELLLIAQTGSISNGASVPGQPTERMNFDIGHVETKTGESASGRRAYEIGRNEPYICYASKPNHFLIRADGRVGKCTVALDHPKNTIGSINEDGTIDVDQIAAQKWYEGFRTFDIDQMGCPLPFVTRNGEATPRSEKQIPATVV